jgi:hypothetical protein
MQNFPIIFLIHFRLNQGCQIFLDTTYQNKGKYTKLPQHIKDHKIYHNIPNDLKIFQMTIKYTSIFHSKALQNWSKLGFLDWKQTIWQPWPERRVCQTCAFFRSKKSFQRSTLENVRLIFYLFLSAQSSRDDFNATFHCCHRLQLMSSINMSDFDKYVQLGLK